MRSTEAPSRSNWRSTTCSPWPLTWRAWTGSRNALSRHRAALPAVSIRSAITPQPRPSLVDGANTSRIKATALLSTWISQPTGPDAGGPAGTRTTLAGLTKSRIDGKACSRLSVTPRRNVRADLRPGDEQGVEHPRPLAAVVGQAAEEQGRPPLAGGDVEGIGRLGAVGLGGIRRQEGGPAEGRLRVGPGPAAGDVVGPGVGPRRAAGARRGRGRRGWIEMSRLGRPLVSSTSWVNRARGRSSRGSWIVPRW